MEVITEEEIADSSRIDCSSSEQIIVPLEQTSNSKESELNIESSGRPLNTNNMIATDLLFGSCPEFLSPFEVPEQTKFSYTKAQRYVHRIEEIFHSKTVRMPPIHRHIDYLKSFQCSDRANETTQKSSAESYSESRNVREEEQTINKHKQNGRVCFEDSQISQEPIENVRSTRCKLVDIAELKEICPLYKVTAWAKMLCQPNTDIVVLMCSQCGTKLKHMKNDSHHLCSRCSDEDVPVYLELTFYLEIIIVDEMEEELKAHLTGKEANKFFNCEPRDFLYHPKTRSRVLSLLEQMVKAGQRYDRYLKEALRFYVQLDPKEEEMDFRIMYIEHQK